MFQRKDSGLSQDLIAKARALGVATLSASMGEPVGRDQIIVRGGVTRVVGSGVSAGPAVTVWNPGGDDTMLRYAIEACRPGDILVVTTPVDGFAQWGDNASTWARGLNIAAVTVDGSVRDVASMREIGVPVWCRSVDPRQALKESPGHVNAPVQIGSVQVRPPPWTWWWPRRRGDGVAVRASGSRGAHGHRSRRPGGRDDAPSR